MTSARASHALPQPDDSRKRPTLEVVRTSRERVRRSGAGIAGSTLIVGLFACVFGVVVFQVLLVQSQSRLDGLNARIEGEETSAKQLHDRITALESPERVVATARDRLDMVPLGDVGYLRPKPDDDARATYDPAEEPVTTTTVATTPSTAASSPSTTSASRNTATTASSKRSNTTATSASTARRSTATTTATKAAGVSATTTRSKADATGATR